MCMGENCVKHNWGVKLKDIGAIYQGQSNALFHYTTDGGRSYSRLRTELIEPWML